MPDDEYTPPPDDESLVIDQPAYIVIVDSLNVIGFGKYGLPGDVDNVRWCSTT